MADSLMVSILIGTLLGFLAGLGVGGGSLLLLWLTAVLEMPPQDARSINLLFFLPAASVSCILHARNHSFRIRKLLPAVFSGCLAALVFSLWGQNMDTDLLKKGFGILLIFTGFRELIFRPGNRDNPPNSGHPKENRRRNSSMIHSDTIKLLRECDAGVKMGVASINEVLTHVTSEDFQKDLCSCKQEHEKLQDEIQQELDKYQDQGKNPNPIAKGMSWMKTNMKLGMEDSDATIADLMTDGCNMGVKSLSRYLNQYKAADEVSKDIAKRLIKQEDQLIMNARPYL